MARRFVKQQHKNGTMAPTPRLRCSIYRHLRPCTPAGNVMDPFHVHHKHLPAQLIGTKRVTGAGGFNHRHLRVKRTAVQRFTLPFTQASADFSFMTFETRAHRTPFRPGLKRSSFGVSAAPPAKLGYFVGVPHCPDLVRSSCDLTRSQGEFEL